MNKSIILMGLLTLTSTYFDATAIKKRPTKALSPEQELKVAKEELTRELGNIKSLEEQRKHINQKIEELHKHYKQNGAIFEKFYLDELYQEKLDELTQLILEEQWIKSQVIAAIACVSNREREGLTAGQIDALNKKIIENRMRHYDLRTNRWLHGQRSDKAYELLDAAYKAKRDELRASLQCANVKMAARK